MKISIVVLSTILILSVFLPFLLFIYNGTSNTSSTKKNIAFLIKDNGIVYSLKEIWRKNFIGISNDNKILTYISSISEQASINNINIEDLKQCNIIKQYKKDKDNVVRLKSLDLELIYKLPVSKNLTIPFFNIDDDLIEDFEIQRIEKWHNLILKAIPLQAMAKIAS
jgi:hypothetical protein